MRAPVGRREAPGNLFHDGDARTVAAARTTWRENGEEIGRGLPWPTGRRREPVRYLAEVRRAG